MSAHERPSSYSKSRLIGALVVASVSEASSFAQALRGREANSVVAENPVFGNVHDSVPNERIAILP
jgi:hypothetical protein